MIDTNTELFYDGAIIDAMLMGSGMPVKIYTKEKCPVCEGKFDPKLGLRCGRHQKLRPHYVYLQVTGVKTAPSGRIRIYTTEYGDPLHLRNVFSLQQKIERELSLGIFDKRNYIPETKSRLRWREYSQVYLAEQKRRTELPQGSDGWLALSSYDELYKYQNLYLIPYFSGHELKEVTKPAIKRFLREVNGIRTKAPASDHIKRRCVEGIRHMLRYAVEEGDLPPLAFTLPTVTKKRKNSITTLSREQQSEILDYLEGHPIFKWAAGTGRRINEYRAMRVGDIDKDVYYVRGAFDKETYKPYPKIEETGGAAIPLTPDLRAILKEALKDRVYGSDDYVFINPLSGRYYKHQTASWLFREAKKKAGYEVTLNEFGRHSWATQRIDEGWSYDDVAKFLLNNSNVVAEKYANVTSATRKRIIELNRGKTNFAPRLPLSAKPKK